MRAKHAISAAAAALLAACSAEAVRTPDARYIAFLRATQAQAVRIAAMTDEEAVPLTSPRNTSAATRRGETGHTRGPGLPGPRGGTTTVGARRPAAGAGTPDDSAMAGVEWVAAPCGRCGAPLVRHLSSGGLMCRNAARRAKS
ncbi:hypothetical protein GCM10009416_11840 [Craurococcus roseus]|uniref:Uncharacterized protein n=1 Tax=Craurococcus roseus TaxID=77585 RepID=A0ABP3PTD9_9PROT